MEILIKERLLAEITEKGLIHKNQLGYQKGKSTVDAARTIKNRYKSKQ